MDLTIKEVAGGLECKITEQFSVHEVRKDTLLIFQSEKSNLKNISLNLETFKDTFKRYNITAICCDINIPITVIPGKPNKEEV